MKSKILIGCTLALIAACATPRISQIKSDGKEIGEVFCGEPAVCRDIKVVRVDFEDRDGGQVQVTLQNQHRVDLQIQIGLELTNAQGAMIDRSSFQSIAMPSGQQSVWTLPGVYQKGAKVRVILRKI